MSKLHDLILLATTRSKSTTDLCFALNVISGGTDWQTHSEKISVENTGRLCDPLDLPFCSQSSFGSCEFTCNDNDADKTGHYSGRRFSREIWLKYKGETKMEARFEFRDGNQDDRYHLNHSHRESRLTVHIPFLCLMQFQCQNDQNLWKSDHLAPEDRGKTVRGFIWPVTSVFVVCLDFGKLYATTLRVSTVYS